MHKAVYAKELLPLFKRLDKRLITGFFNYSLPSKKFDLITMGGTALGLLSLKDVSKDIDLFIKINSVEGLFPYQNAVETAQKIENFIRMHFDESEEIAADVSFEGITGWNLLGFNVKTAGYFSEFACFNLHILHPLDICITKVPRLDEMDVLDIEKAIEKTDATPAQLESRFYAYLNQLKYPKEAEVAIQNFEKLKALNAQFNPNPRRWWQFWRW